MISDGLAYDSFPSIITHLFTQVLIRIQTDSGDLSDPE